jgi:hypothetical protein
MYCSFSHSDGVSQPSAALRRRREIYRIEVNIKRTREWRGERKEVTEYPCKCAPGPWQFMFSKTIARLELHLMAGEAIRLVSSAYPPCVFAAQDSSLHEMQTQNKIIPTSPNKSRADPNVISLLLATQSAVKKSSEA